MSAVETRTQAVESSGLYAAGPDVYWRLLKPRVMSLSVMTALAGLVVAPGHLHPALAFIALVAIAAGAGGAGALNMWWDSDIDGRMARTRLRPIPSGLVAPGEALALGLVLSFFSVLTLALAANLFAAFLLGFTIFFYLVVYSMWLKRLTPQNIVIGGAAGALPPMVGYAAVTGDVTLDSVLLFAIIFVWTPPHFWALALVKTNDYARVDMPMMPNVKGAKRTRLEILAYSLVLAPLGVAPFFTGLGGPVYGAVATVGGAIFLALAWKVYRAEDGTPGNRPAMALFKASIVYLFALYATLIVERAAALALHWR
jgi:heme o synthase